MEFYHDLITQKSFNFLKQLKKNYDFVLIGGWAVFLYSHALKSKDIDVIIDYETLGKLKESYEVTKNDRLKKYEVKTGQFDIDIYLPHYSDLGIEVEKIVQSAVIRKGFTIPQLEALFLLKLRAWQSRSGSAKGKKDELDVLSLAILPEFNWKELKILVKDHSLDVEYQAFTTLLKNTRNIKELGVHEQQMSKLRKNILKKLSM